MKTITRQELYDKIWSITKTKTAKELNIPLAYLTSLCNEYNIPTPTSRYWQELSWGKDVKKDPLPNPEINNIISLTPSEVISVKHKNKTPDNNYSEILDQELEKINKEKEIKELQKKARNGEFAIDFSKECNLWRVGIDKVIQLFKVPEVLNSRREITLKTKAYFRLERLSWNDQRNHPDYSKLQTHLNISTGKDLYDRSLRLFDTIINILESLGGKMKYELSVTKVELGNVDISISISERSKRVEVPEAERQMGNKYKFVNSGLIKVCLRSDVYDAVIEDSTFARVEDKLDTVVKKCLELVKKEYDWREELKRWEIERKRQEEERRLEEERRRQIENLKIEKRKNIRGLYKVLRREMICELVGRILEKKSVMDAARSGNEQILVNKLSELRDLFDPFRTDPIPGCLTETDIDALADEFFRSVSDK